MEVYDDGNDDIFQEENDSHGDYLAAQHHHHHHHDDDDDDDISAVFKGTSCEADLHDVTSALHHSFDPFPFHDEEMVPPDNEMIVPTTPPPTPPPPPIYNDPSPNQQQLDKNEKESPRTTTRTTTTSPMIVEEPTMWDVLAGRGASVNANVGNKRFRASCFARKHEFDAANLAAKRRITAEIVRDMVHGYGTRFLKRVKTTKTASTNTTTTTTTTWQCLSTEQAMLKAAQVMRDFRRPDRAAQRQACTKRNRATATPMGGVPDAGTIVLPPIVELPAGIHKHDVLCGRGAFCNDHVGNQRLRALCMERCEQFHASTYAEKRALAAEVVHVIQSLQPPGRFLQKAGTTTTTCNGNPTSHRDELIAGEWIQVPENKAIQKACQIMRDGKRLDRIQRDEQRRLRKLEKQRAQENAARQQQQQQQQQQTTGMTESGDSSVSSFAPSFAKDPIAVSSRSVYHDNHHHYRHHRPMIANHTLPSSTREGSLLFTTDHLQDESTTLALATVDDDAVAAAPRVMSKISLPPPAAAAAAASSLNHVTNGFNGNDWTVTINQES